MNGNQRPPPAGYRFTNRMIKAYKGNDLSIVAAVREGMAAFKSPRAGANHARVGPSAFGKIKRLLLMLEIADSQEQKDEIEKALAQVDKTRNVDASVQEVFHRYKRHKGKISKRQTARSLRLLAKQQQRLDRMLLTIGETCEANKDVEIPSNLTAEEISAAASVLADSMEIIVRLQRRLLNSKGES